MKHRINHQMESVFRTFGVCLFSLLAAVSQSSCSQVSSIESSSLPSTTELASSQAWKINGLSNCIEPQTQKVLLNMEQPLIVLVHGARGSPRDFIGLAQQLRSTGQQVLCFAYNDRNSLVSSAAELGSSLYHLASRMNIKEVSILGHSLGALVARKALVAGQVKKYPHSEIDFRLITVGGPFGGIAAASGCKSVEMQVLTFGLIIPLCHLISGDKWAEITDRSEFILHPGELHASVNIHLKIETDERGSCRVIAKNPCSKSDYIFSLNEQRNREVDNDPTVEIVTVRAGHQGIIGTASESAAQLISIMENNKLLQPADTLSAVNNSTASKNDMLLRFEEGLN